jgi:hypothetical protein
MKAILTLFVVCLPMCLFAAPWTSKDGKVIEADFVRLSGNSVILDTPKKQFKVPLTRLSRDSQAFAGFMQERRTEWARVNASSLIITEQILREVTAFQPKLTEGKNYLIEGYVGSISQPSALQRHKNTTKVEITLRGGTKGELDFVGKVNLAVEKLKIEKDRVVLLDHRSGKFRPVKNLLEIGKPIVIRGFVKKGVLKGSGLATSQEVMTARLREAKRNGGANLEAVVEMERIKARVSFLEAQLAGNAGTATATDGATGSSVGITYEHSEAEKQAMRKELELLRAQLSAAAQP